MSACFREGMGPPRACFCEIVTDIWGSVRSIEKCVSCELRETLARPVPDDDEGRTRREAFLARLQQAAHRELEAGRRLA